jgi:hypothetical protein
MPAAVALTYRVPDFSRWQSPSACRAVLACCWHMSLLVTRARW